MKATGNGLPQQCVSNLLKLNQYEVPYARLKGMDSSIIDKPCLTAKSQARNHAEWLISTYEPRVLINKIDVNTKSDGSFEIVPDLLIKEY